MPVNIFPLVVFDFGASRISITYSYKLTVKTTQLKCIQHFNSLVILNILYFEMNFCKIHNAKSLPLQSP